MEEFITYKGCSAHTVVLILCTLVLLVCSAMASASEAAFFSLMPADLRDIRARKSMASEAVVRLLGKPESLLATILVINNMVNICIVILSAQVVDNMLEFSSPTVEFLFTGVFVTFLLLLFGEIMPKVLAQGANVGVALALAQPLSVLKVIVSPFSWILIRTSSRIGEMASHTEDISIEELADAVDMATMPESEEQRMLSGIVTFGTREVSAIMRPRVDMKSVEQTMTFTEVLDIVRQTGHSRLPVCNEDLDHIKGTLYVKDLLPYLSLGDEFGWQKLIREPYFVPTHKKISGMLDDFRADKVHMAIVVDEYGATQGLVTLEDILEEVVGEISDESDKTETFYRKVDDRTYLFYGKTHIVDMLRVLQLDDQLLDDVQGRAETVAGLMLELRRDLLKKGDEVTTKNLRFKVTSMEGHRIEEVKVMLPEA